MILPRFPTKKFIPVGRNGQKNLLRAADFRDFPIG